MLKIFVIDGDSVRRTQIGRPLAEHDAHAEPFESLAEFEAYTPDDGLILVHDRDNSVPMVMEHVDRTSCLPAIAYSERPGRLKIVRAMQAGAASYLSLPLAAEDVLSEYRAIAPDLPARIEKRRRAALARAQIERLSRREHEILACMLDHGTSKAIARHLDISPRTVEAHRANLMARLDVTSTSEAIRIAVEGDALDLLTSSRPEGTGQPIAR